MDDLGFYFEKMFGWVRDIGIIRRVTELPWGQIRIGELLGILMLAVCVLLSGLVAANRFFALEFHNPQPRVKIAEPRRKKGFGLRWVAMALVALLPGGLVGSVAVMMLMGKERWREDALKIFSLSLIPLGLLLCMRLSQRPIIEPPVGFIISAILGLTFGMLQAWIAIRLLRESLGEPEECVPWWPPMALWGQTALLIVMCWLALR